MQFKYCFTLKPPGDFADRKRTGGVIHDTAVVGTSGVMSE